MTRTFWTAAAAAVIAFGLGETMSARADDSQTEIAFLQQIAQNTANTNAQLASLNQKISQLTATAQATAAAAQRQQAPNQQSGMSSAPH